MKVRPATLADVPAVIVAGAARGLGVGGVLLDVHLLQKSLAALLLALALPALATPSAEDSLRESALRLAAGDPAQARAHADAAVRADPRSARAWQQLAASAVAGQDHGAARDALERALALTRETPALLILRAQARGGLGDLEGALADTGRALRLSPHSARTRLERARILEALGRETEALGEYERAGALDALLSGDVLDARARLAPAAPSRGIGAGGLFALLALSALGGWAWSRLARRDAPSRATAAPPSPRPAPLGDKPLGPREALGALTQAAGDGGPDEAYALALALHARLTGREALPGAETFFQRALNADPAARFRTPAELLNAFRCLVDPAVH